MRSEDRIMGAVTAGFGLLCIFEAFRIWKGWDGPGTMTFFVGGIFLVVSVFFFVSPRRESTPIKWPSKKEMVSMGVIGGSFGLYVYLMEWLGYLVDTWVFLAFVAKYISPTRLSVIVAWTGAVAVGTYIIFKNYLFIYLPAGFIGI